MSEQRSRWVRRACQETLAKEELKQIQRDLDRDPTGVAWLTPDPSIDVPADVLWALNRLSEPLDLSRYLIPKSMKATLKEDARCMDVIKRHILRRPEVVDQNDKKKELLSR